MGYLGAGVAALGFFLLVAWMFASVDAASLAKLIRYGLGTSLVAVAALMAFGGRWGIAVVLGSLGFSAIAAGRIGPLDLGGGRRSAGSISRVRSAFLEMRLDHDSGVMTGEVVAGEYAGRSLDSLDDASLLKLLEQVAGDGDSVALLEGYLDRRMPGWREDVERDDTARASGPADTGTMTDQQAYEILGLAPGASETEIRAAHRRLMKRVHPDQGGSTFLAAKINQAKDWLLGRHH